MFTVYKTTNLKNGKFYIGKHKTYDPGDGYLGSGDVLVRAVAKYGVSNFKKEVLFIFTTEQEAYNKEVELLIEARQSPLCYNIHQGGTGWPDTPRMKEVRSANATKNARTRNAHPTPAMTLARSRTIKSLPCYVKNNEMQRSKAKQHMVNLNANPTPLLRLAWINSKLRLSSMNSTPVVCDLCGRTVSNKGNLAKHKKREHTRS